MYCADIFKRLDLWLQRLMLHSLCYNRLLKMFCNLCGCITPTLNEKNSFKYYYSSFFFFFYKAHYYGTYRILLFVCIMETGRRVIYVPYTFIVYLCLYIFCCCGSLRFFWRKIPKTVVNPFCEIYRTRVLTNLNQRKIP